MKYVLHMHYDMFYISCLAHRGIYGMFINSIILNSMAIQQKLRTTVYPPILHWLVWKNMYHLEH